MFDCYLQITNNLVMGNNFGLMNNRSYPTFGHWRDRHINYIASNPRPFLHHPL